MSDLAQELEAAMVATAAALEAGDAEAAADATGRVNRAWAALQAAGTRLPPDVLARLSALQARSQAAAEQVMARLGVELAGAARTTRAVAAYKR